MIEHAGWRANGTVHHFSFFVVVHVIFNPYASRTCIASWYALTDLRGEAMTGKVRPCNHVAMDTLLAVTSRAALYLVPCQRRPERRGF